MPGDVKNKANDATAKVAKYIAGARYDVLPPEVIAKAKLHILDTIGAMLAGHPTRPGQVGYRVYTPPTGERGVESYWD